MLSYFFRFKSKYDEIGVTMTISFYIQLGSSKKKVKLGLKSGQNLITRFIKLIISLSIQVKI